MARRPARALPATEIHSRLHVSLDGRSLHWRIAGWRPKSAQHSDRSRAVHRMKQACAAKREREQCRLLLLAALAVWRPLGVRWVPPARVHLRVLVWCWHPSHEPDPLSLGDHAKYAIDAVVEEGLITDDGPPTCRTGTGECPPERPGWLPQKGDGFEFIAEALDA